ncbi:MAG TPA: energy transducer TonB [Thermoanaerobaculia bacterium]
MAFAQDFYEAQLRVGESSLAAGHFRDASDDLRIAAFGLLDRPALLCEALANLALADQGAGRQDAVDVSLRRMVAIARLFPECRQAHLDPGRRQEFEALARRRLGAPVADSLVARAPESTALAAPTTVATPRAAVPTPTPPSPTAAPPPPPPTPIPTAAAPVSVTARPVASEGVADLDREPQLKSTTKPVYPPTAESAGVRGIVLLKVLVSPKGQPLRVEVARGVRSDLDDAAVAAVRQWTFEPGSKAGTPVPAWMTVAVPFEPVRR